MAKNNKTSKKIGLALSGGGYRAAAYHIGTLRALNRLGILHNVDVISSVSGGSITAAYYALNKENYENFESSFIKKLQKGVLVVPIINLLLLLIIAVLIWFTGWWVLFVVVLFRFQYKLLPFSFFIEKAYDKLFFKNATLSDLPKEKPLVAINATDVDSQGTPFTFSSKKMTGFLYRTVDGESPFDHKNFPVSKAVMASSCVPFAFSPVGIPRKYYIKPKDTSNEKLNPRRPMLLDGGLFDNQGAQKLGNKNSSYHTQLNIVSDAGNSIINSKWAFNIPLMLVKVSDIMMRRIRTLQLVSNVFEGIKGDVRYVYLSLSWGIDETQKVEMQKVEKYRLVEFFVNNIVDDNIAPELYKLHKIKDSDIAEIKSSDSKTSNDAKKRVALQLKENIGWSNLETMKPTAEEYNIALSVGTNLTALSKKQIDALIKHSNWLTELQIRLHMPYLIDKK